MKFGLIIASNDPETVWNAFRLGNLALKKGDEVKIFLLGKGVEYESLNTEKFNVRDQANSFLSHKGQIHACQTCLSMRDFSVSEPCQISTLNDLYEILRDSDKVISF